VEVWGTGSASREFLYVQDAAAGIALAAEHYNQAEPVNLGSGEEITIRQLVDVIADVCGFKGTVRWNSAYPDGQPRRCLETSRAASAFGFKASTRLREGLLETIDWFAKHRLAEDGRAKPGQFAPAIPHRHLP
jgi:GDP-L-fucose synthase